MFSCSSSTLGGLGGLSFDEIVLVSYSPRPLPRKEEEEKKKTMYLGVSMAIY